MEPLEFNDIEKLSPYYYKFTLKNSHVSYANTLRRIIMTGVETIAFRADMTSAGTTTDVQIVKNTTPMTNEMLAHRIGLIPIYVEEPLKWDSEKYDFSIVVNGNKETIRDVTASDFVVIDKKTKTGEPEEIPTQLFFPVNPITKRTSLIATLEIGESNIVQFNAKATIGTGRENARFQPTSQCSYEYTRDTDQVRRLEMFKKWVIKAKNIPDFDDEDKESEKYKALWREYNTMEVSRCYLQDGKGEPYSFDFIIESVGVLDIPYIVKRACDVGEAMFSRYSNITREIPEEVNMIPSVSRVPGAYDFTIKGHDHTFGNMMQTYLVENFINKENDIKITYAGYKVPHPLRDEMVLRIAGEKREMVLKAFEEAAKGCAEVFRAMRSTWMRSVGMAA